MEGRMSAIGRWVGLGDGLAEGVGEAAVGLGVTFAFAFAWTVLPAWGAASPVNAVGACDVAATAGAVALEVGLAVERSGAGRCLLTDAVGVAARAGGAAELATAGLDGAAAAVGAAWPPEAEAAWREGPGLAAGVA
jgi:hypothetical protein